MKNKKIIAVALCIGIAASSFSGALTSYAKDELAKKEATKEEATKKETTEKDFNIKKVTPDFDKSMVKSLPQLGGMIDLEPEVYDQDEVPDQKIIVDPVEGDRNVKNLQESKEKVLYESTQSTLDSEEKNMFHFGAKEIEEMMQKGYSMEDIFEADEIANELSIEPEELLEKKEGQKTSLERIRKDILKESKEKTIKTLRDKYRKAYKKLEDKNIKQNDIIKILTYADMNDAEVSDSLIEKYQKEGDEIFQKVIQSNKDINYERNQKASSEINKSNELSIEETNDLSEKYNDKLEKLSKKTGKSVQELIDCYNKSNKNQDTKKN